MSKISEPVELLFALEIVDGWPPVAIEGLHCAPVAGGYYRVETPPLFVKGLSVDDVISVSKDSDGNIESWAYVKKSHRSTIWLVCIGNEPVPEEVLQKLRSMNCSTVRLQQYRCYSIDVPAKCTIEDVDMCLSHLDESNVAIAYPSFRHEDTEE